MSALKAAGPKGEWIVFPLPFCSGAILIFRPKERFVYKENNILGGSCYLATMQTVYR